MIEHLNEDTFKEKIFDYTKEKEFKFLGDKPALIDFYAEWCGPCKTVSPILEELAKEYAGVLDIYKINTEKEQNISSMFGIRSIPSLLFLPKEGEPQMAQGAMPKGQFEKLFKDILGVDKPEKKDDEIVTKEEKKADKQE